MKFVTFNAVTGEGDTGELARQAPFAHGEPGEDDIVRPFPSAAPQAAPQEATHPVTIVNPGERIRSFSPRKYGRSGTRIVFLSGAGLPVLESVDEVRAALEAVG